MAPEIIKGSYNEKCDIWSVGVILYILLCGKPPFNSGSDEGIMAKVRLGKYDFNYPEFKHVSEKCINFIKRLMEVDVDKRYFINFNVAD